MFVMGTRACRLMVIGISGKQFLQVATRRPYGTRLVVGPVLDSWGKAFTMLWSSAEIKSSAKADKFIVSTTFSCMLEQLSLTLGRSIHDVFLCASLKSLLLSDPPKGISKSRRTCRGARQIHIPT